MMRHFMPRPPSIPKSAYTAISSYDDIMRRYFRAIFIIAQQVLR